MVKSESAPKSPLEDVFVVDNDVHIEETPGLMAKYFESPYDDAVRSYEKSYRYRDTSGFMPGMKLGDIFRNSPASKHAKRPDLTNGENTERELKKYHVDVGVLFGENALKIPILQSVEYANAFASAYNDYLIDRFLDQSDALIGAIAVAPHDPHAAAEEIDRVANEKQMKAIFLPIGGLDRTYGHSTYRPIWEAASEHSLPIIFHSVGVDFPEFPFNMHKLPYLTRHTLAHELSLVVNCMHIVNEGIPVLYPDLKFVFLEAGLSWMPMTAYRLDREYMQHREQAPLLEKRPSEYIDEFYVGTHPIEVPENPAELAVLLDQVNGEETAVFATDIPHHDWDDAGAIQSMPISKEAKEKIWGLNAKKLYNI